MIGLIQRVINASVSVNDRTVSKIDKGLVILLGITNNDSLKDAEYVCNKTVSLRLFESQENNFDFSLKDVEGDLLVISQFTLPASVTKGRRPDFTNAANATIAKPLYETFIKLCRDQIDKVETGEFGSDMVVNLTNNGPVTIIIDSMSN